MAEHCRWTRRSSGCNDLDWALLIVVDCEEATGPMAAEKTSDVEMRVAGFLDQNPAGYVFAIANFVYAAVDTRRPRDWS
jgi:hypothetical protein